jgi:predicted ATPase
LEHFGAGEAYMPLLDAFTVLARTAQGTTLISALRRYAPTWLLEMPGLLPGPERKQLRREVEGTTRERMLRELTEVINVIAADTPLVLVLEDLHWSDYPTLDALAALARRCATARLLVIGTYRPVDMTFTNHPLKRMKQELEAHGHCTEIALPLFDEPTVATHLQVLLTDGDPRQLGDVAKTVYQRTEGNPLFIVNLVSDLLAQGVLEVHEGHWQLSPAKRDLMLDVPSKVQHLIARQIERLDDDTQHLLEGASASGVTFVAAVAAAITGQERSWVEQRCEELAQQRHLLHVVNVTQLADGTLSSRYAFAHAMYQQVLYQRISAMRQIQFHQRMGQFAERLYGAQAKEHAAELVRHFELGREYRLSMRYGGMPIVRRLFT